MPPPPLPTARSPRHKGSYLRSSIGFSTSLLRQLALLLLIKSLRSIKCFFFYFSCSFTVLWISAVYSTMACCNLSFWSTQILTSPYRTSLTESSRPNLLCLLVMASPLATSSSTSLKSLLLVSSTILSLKTLIPNERAAYRKVRNCHATFYDRCVCVCFILLFDVFIFDIWSCSPFLSFVHCKDRELCWMSLNL